MRYRTIPKSRLSDFAPPKSEMFEMLDQPLYDIQWLEAGIEEACFFSRALGVVVDNAPLTEADTNMLLPAALPAPRRFLIHEIRLEVVQETPQGSEERERLNGALYSWGSLELLIGSRIYHVGAPLGLYMGNGFLLSYPFLLEPMQNFRVMLKWPTIRLSRRLRVACYLEGVLARMN